MCFRISLMPVRDRRNDPRNHARAGERRRQNASHRRPGDPQEDDDAAQHQQRHGSHARAIKPS